MKLIGKEKEVFEFPYEEQSYRISFLSKSPTPLHLDKIEDAKVYVYNNVIIAVQLPYKPLLQLGFPYKETEYRTYQEWDSHDHSHYTRDNVPVKCYNYLCYCSEHPLIKKYLEDKR